VSLGRASFVSDVTTVFCSCDVAMVVIELIRTAPADGGHPTDGINAETDVTSVRCEENENHLCRL
jgi:hypothetical protein